LSNFPSVLSTISDPTAINRLNAPSHSSIESAQNDAIKKLETFVGTLSSAAGTLMYDVRGAGSDGGGHVQGANKGGTGQTAYTKGDILVAQSSSVLSKLAIGANDQLLVADNTQQVGMKWTDTAAGRIATSADRVYTGSTTGVVSVLSVNIPGSTLGTAGVIRARVFLQNVTIFGSGADPDAGDIRAQAHYGTASMLLTSVFSQVSAIGVARNHYGECTLDIIASGSVATQRMIFSGKIYTLTGDKVYTSIMSFYSSSVIGVESSSTVGLVIQFQNNQAHSLMGVITDGYIVEKI